MNLGDELYEIVRQTIAELFELSEFVTLTHMSFNTATKAIQDEQKPIIAIEFPIVINTDGSFHNTKQTYNKEELIQKLQRIANNELMVNSVFKLVSEVEAMLEDVLRKVIKKYPSKISKKKTISYSEILESESFEVAQNKIIDSIVAEMSYFSPKSFAEEAKKYISIDLFDFENFNDYVELKATRDIYMHNKGIVNHRYVDKSGSKCRVKNIGGKLSVDARYFYDSYELCLSLCDWLEETLHSKWFSSKYEDRKNRPPLSDDEKLLDNLKTTFSKLR